MEIQRVRGPAVGRNQAVAYSGLAWAVGAACRPGLGFADQMRETLQIIDQSLAALGTDKTRLLSAQVFLADMADKPRMDEAWNAWLGPNPDHWPQRACVGAPLTGDLLVEITVVAAAKPAAEEPP